LIKADAFYPARLAVGDPMHVAKGLHTRPEPTTPAYLATTMEFMVRVCKGLVPYKLDHTGVQLYADQVGKIGAVFATRTARGHYLPTGRIQCYAGRPCVFLITAMIYESQAGLPMHKFGRCDFGDSIVDSLTGRNTQNSSKCVDNLRKLVISQGAEVYIDTIHAGLQGCPNSLINTDGTSHSCHKIEHLPPPSAGEGLNVGIGVVNITLFGKRGFTGGVGVGGALGVDGGGQGIYTYPYEHDIGKKIPMCFQARECPKCCYSLPHCITVEILGREPQVLSPAVEDTCPTKTFQSDLKPLNLLPPLLEYKAGCPHLYTCWTELNEPHPQTSASAPPETAAVYSHPSLIQDFVLSAQDHDEGETVDIELLWEPKGSSLSRIDPTLVKYTPYTLHPGGTCDQQAVLRARDIYKLDSTCRKGQIHLRIEFTYSNNWQSRVNSLAGRTPIYTLNGPKIVNEQDGYYHVAFDEDKTICFTSTDNQATKWGRGLNNSALRCHVVRFRGPPIFVRHHQRPLDAPFLSVDSNLMGYGMQTLEALVGKETSFTVRARDPNPEDVVTIVQNQDPGLPTGSTLDRDVCVEHGLVSDKTGVPNSLVFSRCSETLRVFRWRPPAGTEGNVFRVCFVAKDNSPFCRVSNPPPPAATPPSPPRATEEGYYSQPYCVQLNVTQARVAWLPGTEATAQGANRILNVGCTSSYVVRATGGQYPVEIRPAPRINRNGIEEATFSVPGINIVTVSMTDTLHDALVQWLPERGTEGSITRVCVVAAPKGWGRAASTTYASTPYIAEYGNPVVVGGGRFSEERCFNFKVSSTALVMLVRECLVACCKPKL